MYSYLAEFFASLFIAYIILATGNPLAIGAAYALALLLIYRVSSAGINPAVTIMMAAAGKISPSDIIPYSIVQILGSLVALELFKRYGV